MKKNTFVVPEMIGSYHKSPIMFNQMLTEAMFNLWNQRLLQLNIAKKPCNPVCSSQRSYSFSECSPWRDGVRESFGNCQEIFIGNIWKTTKSIALTYFSLKGVLMSSQCYKHDLIRIPFKMQLGGMFHNKISGINLTVKLIWYIRI